MNCVHIQVDRPVDPEGSSSLITYPGCFRIGSNGLFSSLSEEAEEEALSTQPGVAGGSTTGVGLRLISAGGVGSLIGDTARILLIEGVCILNVAAYLLLTGGKGRFLIGAGVRLLTTGGEGVLMLSTSGGGVWPGDGDCILDVPKVRSVTGEGLLSL